MSDVTPLQISAADIQKLKDSVKPHSRFVTLEQFHSGGILSDAFAKYADSGKIPITPVEYEEKPIAFNVRTK